jgi:hypothetical protein
LDGFWVIVEHPDTGLALRLSHDEEGRRLFHTSPNRRQMDAAARQMDAAARQMDAAPLNCACSSSKPSSVAACHDAQSVKDAVPLAVGVA